MESDLVKRFQKLSRYLNNLSAADLGTVGGEAALYACNILARIQRKQNGKGFNGLSFP